MFKLLPLLGLNSQAFVFW